MKKRKSKLYKPNKAKMLIASTVAVSVVAGVATVGNVEKAEASVKYNYSKYHADPIREYQYTLAVTGTGSTIGWDYTVSGYTSIYVDPKTGQITGSGHSTIGNGTSGSVWQISGRDAYQIQALSGGREIYSSPYYVTQSQVITGYKRASYLSNVQADYGTYPSNGRHTDGYWYEIGSPLNQAPNTPTLTVPTLQFEHGDKHILGWNATDPNGDRITYTLQASYSGGVWESLYNGTAKTYTYTVPNNKGTSVKFRVIASDGQLTSTSADSAVKSIREVMYYWNKFNNKEIQGERIATLNNSKSYFEGSISIPRGNTIRNGIIADGGIYQIIREHVYIRTDYFEGENRYVDVYETYRNYYDITYNAPTNSKGTIIQNDLQAGYNSYTHGVRNTDGYWYERGQRVLATDTTPPIIELTEQSNVGATSTVSVRTHDLGTVNTVKWAQGSRDVNYFATNGTTIGTGQSTASSFNVNANGIYTVYAVDTIGNKAVQTIEVKKVNSAPIINFVSAESKFNVVDETNNFKINVNAIDVDSQNLSSHATYGNGLTANSSNLELILSGSGYSKGFHTTPITVTVNDGIINSAAMNLDNHIVIRVDNATDYMRLLNSHTNDANNFTTVQHQAFFEAYEAVLAYESGKTQALYDAVISAINAMKTATGIQDSATINEWNERLAILFTTAALTKAEQSLTKADYENVVEMFDALTLDSNKSLIHSRLGELEKYHVASDLLVTMETEVVRHKANTATALDTTIINVENFNQVKSEIAKTANTAEANYKTNLNTRYNTLRNYYLNNKSGLTPEDLTELAPNVDPNLNGEYDELKDAFGDLGTNAQHLVNYTNVVMKFLYHVNGPTKDEYHAVVAGFPTNTGIDFAKLGTISIVIDNLHAFRSAFRENAPGIAAISQDIVNATTGGTLVKGYMEQVRVVMKEVTEYNDVELDEKHSETERHEADILIPLLKAGQFQTDMTEYLTNEIPIVMIERDPYEYIVNGTIVVTGEITDNNDTEHTVTAKLGDESLSQTTANKQFSITFNRAEGVYLHEPLTVNVNDGLTNKAVTVHNKPIISVSNPTLYKEMLNLLEEDRGENVVDMSHASLTELISIMNQMVMTDLNSSPLLTRNLYYRTEQLSLQNEGQLEKFVRDYIQATYLEWLFANYLTATVDDFEFAGILKDGQKIVNYENIMQFKTVITDYINHHAPAVAPTPTLQDYIQWGDMLVGMGDLDALFIAIYELTTSSEIFEAIEQAEEEVNTKIPTWVTQRTLYDTKIADAKHYENAVKAVEKAELTFVQIDHDSANLNVSTVKDADAKIALENRLTEVQKVIDAIEVIEQAELTASDADIQAAQEILNLVAAGTKKAELQTRLDAVKGYNGAEKAVTIAEGTFEQVDHDNAKSLVDAISDGQRKTDLLARLAEVKKVIDAIKAIEQAELTASDADIQAAQDALDLVADGTKKAELQAQLDTVKAYNGAEKAVMIAEGTFEQIDHDNAKTLVEAIAEGERQTDLLNRLVEVQKVIDAIGAIEQAELTTSDADIQTAQDTLDLVAEGTKKTELQNRLDAVKGFNSAEKAVTIAEDTFSQVDHDNAKALVDVIAVGQQQVDLLNRLAEVQKVINAIGAIEQAELSASDSDIQAAQDALDLVTAGPKKVELQTRLDAVKEYSEAVKAIAQAEQTYSQVDYDNAAKEISEVEEGQAKVSLLARLAEVQRVIDAINAITQAESTASDVDIQTAQEKLDLAADSIKKVELQVQLDAVKGYNGAEKAVTKAEGTFLQEDFDNAKAFVDAIAEDQRKLDLLARLGEVQKVINAIKAIGQAELTASDADIQAAQDALDLVADGTKKSELQNRLDAVQEYADAVKAVVQAEITLEQTTKDTAQALVDALPTSNPKDTLQERLDEVQKVIDAQTLVGQAESSKEQTNVNDAQTAIDAIELKYQSEKDRLQERLDEVIRYIEAEKAVTDAETSIKQSDKDRALELVDALEDSPEKDALLERLDQLQDAIDKKTAEEKATDRVENAEDTWDRADLESAQDEVNDLADGTTKDELQVRLDQLAEIIQLYEDVRLAVEKAETTKNPTDATAAQDKLNELTDLIEGTNDKTNQLQERIDNVNQYIEAEKAVTLAETSKFERHVNEAQQLVSNLIDSEDKLELQERLDKLKAEIADKANDILDRIVNGEEITPQELADYTNETVYEELLEDYLEPMREIADKTGELTKDDVIQVVKLINSMEIAKRSMNDSDILTYEQELAATPTVIRGNYPKPNVMYATSAYLADDAGKLELAHSLADLLERDVTDILEEMDSLLAGIEEVTAGFYKVHYINEDTQEIVSEQMIEAEFGEITVAPTEIEGYELITTEEVSFELNKETIGKVISFLVKVDATATTEDSAEVETGSYMVSYQLTDGTIVDSENIENIDLGTVLVQSRPISGYTIIGNETQMIELTKEEPNKSVIFYLQPDVQNTTGDTAEVETENGGYTVKYQLEDGTVIHTDLVNDVPLGNIEVRAIELEGYAIEGDTSAFIKLTKENPYQQVVFIVEKLTSQTTEDTANVSSTIGIQSGFVRSLKVASLNDLDLTFTTVASVSTVSHQQYLYQAAQSLLMVKAYMDNPSQLNLDAAMNFVVTNLYDGYYKAYLLELLNSNSTAIGEDGEPDLTPVYPTPPYVEPTPTEPEPVEPTPVQPIPQPVPTPPVVSPGGPIIVLPPKVEVPEETETVATPEKIHDVIEGADGSYTWIIDNPENINYDLSATSLGINVTFDKSLIEGTKKLEIIWKYQGNEHYRLIILADGKEVSLFDAKIELKKARDFAYMLRKVGNEYKAMPYVYQSGVFNFKVTRTGVFYFSKEKKTFKDIAKFDTKDAIEELASRHIVFGDKDKFNPNGKLTRAQFAAMISRALGLEASEKETPFKDTKGKWYEKDIQAIYEAGIASGTSASMFNPDASMTRQQAALMLNKIIERSDKKEGLFITSSSGNNSFAKLPTFADAHAIADNAKKAVATLEYLNIVQGKENGYFDPNGTLTRSQMAKMLNGVLTYTGDM